MVNYTHCLKKHFNDKEKCSLCGRKIPRDVDRVSFLYKSRYGGNYKRICGLCIIALSTRVDRKPIEEWKEKIMVEEL